MSFTDVNQEEQDKMFGYQTVVQGYPVYAGSVGSNYPGYYAPMNTGCQYVMNPMVNAMCTWRNGAMIPAMPVLQAPSYPNPNFPMYAPGQPQIYPQHQPQHPKPPVPNPNYRPPNQGPNQPPIQPPVQPPIQRPNSGPNQRPNQRPNQGLNQQPNQPPYQGPNQQPNQGYQQPPQRLGNGGQFNDNQRGDGYQGQQNSRPRSDNI